jgi:hypothetical protein
VVLISGFAIEMYQLPIILQLEEIPRVFVTIELGLANIVNEQYWEMS